MAKENVSTAKENTKILSCPSNLTVETKSAAEATMSVTAFMRLVHLAESEALCSASSMILCCVQ